MFKADCYRDSSSWHRCPMLGSLVWRSDLWLIRGDLCSPAVPPTHYSPHRRVGIAATTYPPLLPVSLGLLLYNHRGPPVQLVFRWLPAMAVLQFRFNSYVLLGRSEFRMYQLSRIDSAPLQIFPNSYWLSHHHLNMPYNTQKVQATNF